MSKITWDQINICMSIIKKIKEGSDFPEVEVPEFKSQIPEELLQNVTPEMKHMLEQQSIQTQAVTWLCNNQKTVNKQVRKLDVRAKDVENWKTKLTSTWSLGLALIVIGSALINLLLKVSEFADKLPLP